MSNANPRAAISRVAGLSSSGVGSQQAHDLRKGPQPKYVKKSLSKDNRKLVGYASGPELWNICEERRKQRNLKRGMKSNAQVGWSLLIGFGHEAHEWFEQLTKERQDAAFREVAERIAERLNTSLHGLMVHVDETSLHAHGMFAGFDKEGMPLTETAKRGALRDMQTITHEVMLKYDDRFERGKSRMERLKEGEEYADTVHKSGREMRQGLAEDIPRLRADIAEMETKAAGLQAKMEKNERLSARSQEKAKEAADNEEKAAKALKNAQTYEKRLTDAQEALRATEERIQALSARIEQLDQRERELDQREADLKLAQAEGRAEGLKAIEDARKAAQALAGGEFELPDVEKLAMTVRKLAVSAAGIAQDERENVHRRSAYADRKTDEWRVPLRRYQEQLGPYEWQNIERTIKNADVQGKAALEELASNKTGSLVDRVLAMTRGLAQYWNGLAQAFRDCFPQKLPPEIIAKGILEDVVSRPVIDYGYLQPYVREAKREIETLNLAEQLAARSGPRGPGMS